MKVSVIEATGGDDGNGPYTAAEMFEDAVRMWLTDGYRLEGFAAAMMDTRAGTRLYGVLVKREEK